MSVDSSNELAQRRAKLNALREQGVNPFTNGFIADATTSVVHANHAEHDADALESVDSVYSIAGRIMAKRDFGKAAFIQLQDRAGRLQVYVAKNQVGEESFEVFRKLDLGDVIGLSGRPFRTKTNELSLRAESLQLLTKCCVIDRVSTRRQLPDLEVVGQREQLRASGAKREVRDRLAVGKAA